ncbi:hypothetical protein TNCV_4770811 [Trichonephila clavipes]|nr:hypothetical protein TNCV_4770811 [Trichonephila clavipes]
MHSEYVGAQTSSRWCGVEVRRGECQLRCGPRPLTRVQNDEVRRPKPSSSWSATLIFAHSHLTISEKALAPSPSRGVSKYRVKLVGEVENILRSHNYIGNHERKRNPNEIKRPKDSEATTQNVV